jgi:hypothetical protein
MLVSAYDGVTSVELFVLVFAVLVTYAVSLMLNPWVKCSKCHGKPEEAGRLLQLRAPHLRQVRRLGAASAVRPEVVQHGAWQSVGRRR